MLRHRIFTVAQNKDVLWVSLFHPDITKWDFRKQAHTGPLRTTSYTFPPNSPRPCPRQAPSTRRSPSSPGPRRCRGGCDSGCECSSGPPASPSRWGSRTLPPAPASPPPEGTEHKGLRGPRAWKRCWCPVILTEILFNLLLVLLQTSAWRYLD